MTTPFSSDERDISLASWREVGFIFQFATTSGLFIKDDHVKTQIIREEFTRNS